MGKSDRTRRTDTSDSPAATLGRRAELVILLDTRHLNAQTNTQSKRAA